jgi:TonB-linked SusC/RagA family outer membrane protein
MKNEEKQVYLRRDNIMSFAKFLLVGIFLAFQLSASAQERTISGTVTDVKNEPLTGVTIAVKGTTVGTLTDVNGKFTLHVSATAKTLSFSYVGMVSQEVEIASSNIFNVILSENTQSIDEIVIVGYGTQKKVSVTGSIVSVRGSDIIKSPTASISSSLAGRVTGLTTVQLSGQPGVDDPNIYVRGIGSLTEAASTPLMLVDGVERSFTQLDPNEVESISILKDASATAVYGIRGANGVIIVTTKRGTEGTPKISFSSSAGLQVPTRLVDLTDSYQYATVFNAAQLSDNPAATVKFTPAAIEAFKAENDGTATIAQKLIYPNTDWIKLIVKPTSFQSQENINISGGTKIVKYFASLGHLSQDGMFNTFSHGYNWGYNRYNYRANVDIDATKSTKISLTIGGQSEITQAPGTSTTYAPNIAASIFQTLYWAVPYAGGFYQGKEINVGNRYISGSGDNYNGLSAINYGQSVTQTYRDLINIDIDLTQKMDFITKGLSWRFKISNNNSSVHAKVRSNSIPTYDPYYKCDVDATALGDSTVVFRENGENGLLGYSESTSKTRSWYLETALNYDYESGPHHVTGLLLYNENRIFYPSTFTDIPLGYVGIAARATYSYSSKYLLDLDLGYNGSENFAPGKRFGLFPAVSLGWVLTEENFLKNKISFLNFLKLRISYGIVGNDKLGGSRFLYLPDSYSVNTGQWYSFGTLNPTGAIVAREGTIGNPLVTWEKAAKQNYGFDIRMFKGLSISADYFYEYRNNILATRNTVPTILSITLPAMNLGKVENHGYEAEMKWRSNFGLFNYYISTNMSFSRNKIIYMDEIPQDYPYLSRTGKPIGEVFGYVFDAFWTADDITHYKDFANSTYIPKAGDARYKDLNGDGIINTDDQRVIGYPDRPEYNFSLSGGVDYKGFDISMLWNGVTNVSRVLNDTWRVAFQAIGDRALIKYLADNSWTPETATTATLPRISFTGKNNNTLTSTLWVRDASYLRLKDIEIGYKFSVSALKRLGISSLRVYANGFDLITFDKLKFMDPEARTSSPDYPLMKIFNLGLTVNF